MRRFIQEMQGNFTESILHEASVDFLEGFMIDAIRNYRYQGKQVPEILRNTLPLVLQARAAYHTGSAKDWLAPDLEDELDAFGAEFDKVDHVALADAILAAGIDVDEDYKKTRDSIP